MAGMERRGPAEDAGDEGGAEQAFEALRAEVAALRRGVELVYRQGSQKDQEAAAPVDYSPTLGVIAKGLQGIEGRLAVIEGKPGLELTPARFEAEIARAAAVGRRLAQAGSSLMSTLPPGSTDTEIGLHLIHENVSRFEKAVRTLELTMEELPSSNGD